MKKLLLFCASLAFMANLSAIAQGAGTDGSGYAGIWRSSAGLIFITTEDNKNYRLNFKSKNGECDITLNAELATDPSTGWTELLTNENEPCPLFSLFPLGIMILLKA